MQTLAPALMLDFTRHLALNCCQIELRFYNTADKELTRHWSDRKTNCTMWPKPFWSQRLFLTSPACFWIPIFFFNFNYNCFNSLDMWNLQAQVKKAFCYQKLFCPSTVWINCSSDLKNFETSQPLTLSFTKLRFRRSFWDTEWVCTFIGSIAMT